MYITEQQALAQLGVRSFGEMTRDRIPAFAQLLPQMDRELAIKALEQFPAYAQMADGVVNCYMNAANNAISSAGGSSRAAAYTVQTAAQALSRQLENNNLNWINRSDINEKLIELSRMAVTIDQNHKNFLKKIAGIAGGVAVAVAGAAAVFFGTRNNRH